VESDQVEVGWGSPALLRRPLPGGRGVPVYGALYSGITRQPPQVFLPLQNLGFSSVTPQGWPSRQPHSFVNLEKLILERAKTAAFHLDMQCLE